MKTTIFPPFYQLTTQNSNKRDASNKPVAKFIFDIMMVKYPAAVSYSPNSDARLFSFPKSSPFSLGCLNGSSLKGYLGKTHAPKYHQVDDVALFYKKSLTCVYINKYALIANSAGTGKFFVMCTHAT